jgi:hypothetical protein
MQTLSDIIKEWVNLNNISNSSVINQNDFSITQNNLSLLPDFSNILYNESLLKKPVHKEEVSTIEEILNDFYNDSPNNDSNNNDSNNDNDSHDNDSNNDKKKEIEHQLKTHCNLL